MSTHTIKCAKCNVPVEKQPSAQAEDIVGCPICGVSDTQENVVREAGDYATSKVSSALDSMLEGFASGSESMTYQKGPRDHKSYRFIVDYEPRL